MSNSHRSAHCYLLTEQRNHRTIWTKDIAKAGGYKLGYTWNLAINDCLVERLAINLTDALRTTHDIRRVHCLVGRYHDKFLGSVFHRHICYHARSIYIILHCLSGIVLHHWHMLIGCGMEHIVGTMHTEDALHTLGISDACHYCLAINIRIILLHVETHVVHGCFGLVDEHQSFWFEQCNLLNHFRTYRPSGSCYEYDLILQQTTYGFHIHLNLVARQQILNIHLPHLQVKHLAFAVPFLSRGHHHNLYACLRQTVNQFLILAECLGAHRTDKQGANTIPQHVFY